MTTHNITFIGAGNMAFSIIGGLIDNGYPADCIYAIDPNAEQLSKLKSAFAIQTSAQAEDAKGSDCVVLAVKPQIMRQVLAAYSAYVNVETTLFISIAAGITCASLQKWLSPQSAIVRCMPNTPALVQTGATVLFANAHVNTSQQSLAENILSAVGLCSWTDEEEKLHAVTATSGSGPAYFFLLMEQMQAAAESLGLQQEQARELVTQTALGAAKMAIASPESLATLRENVTSKGGTTAAALEVFSKANLNESVKLALQAAASRSREMAELFDEA